MSLQGCLSVAEREKYRDIFLHLNPRDGRLSGSEAQTVLLKSGLLNSDLNQIWNLSDLDHDGQLNCEEFIICMHLIFNALNGSPIPNTLPPYLLPLGYTDQENSHHSLNHEGSSATSTGPGIYVSNKNFEFTDTFDWYISPMQKLRYENTFQDAPLKSELLSKEHALEILLSNSRPREEFEVLWNLIDVFQKGYINFQQFSYFHHIMDAKKSKKPFPISVPPEIILTFKSSTPTTTPSKLSVLSPILEKHSGNSPCLSRRRSFVATDQKEISDLTSELTHLELQLATATNPNHQRKLLDDVQAMLSYLDTVSIGSSTLETTMKSVQQDIKQTELQIQRERHTAI